MELQVMLLIWALAILVPINGLLFLAARREKARAKKLYEMRLRIIRRGMY